MQVPGGLHALKVLRDEMAQARSLLEEASSGFGLDDVQASRDPFVCTEGLQSTAPLATSAGCFIGSVRCTPSELDQALCFDELPTPTYKVSAPCHPTKLGLATQAVQPRSAPSAEEVALVKARVLSRMAFEEFRVEQSSTDGAADQVKRLRQQCSATKVRIHTSVVSMGRSAEKLKALEASMGQLEDMVSRLQHVRAARLADVALCEQRLNILLEPNPRDDVGSKTFHPVTASGPQYPGPHRGPPPGVMPGDARCAVVEAVEVERQTLAQARRELTDLEEECKEMMQGLSEVQTDVVKAAADCRSAIRTDHAKLISLVGKLTERRSEDTRSRSATAGNSTYDNILAQRCSNLQELAAKLCDKSSTAIQWTARQCARASARTRDRLVTEARDVQVVRNRLEAQTKELESAVSAAEWGRTRAMRQQSLENSDASIAAAARSEKASVLLHELLIAQKHLRNLIRRAASNQQAIESCRRITPGIAAAAAYGNAASAATAGHGESSRPQSRGSASTPSLSSRGRARQSASPSPARNSRNLSANRVRKPAARPKRADAC